MKSMTNRNKWILGAVAGVVLALILAGILVFSSGVTAPGLDLSSRNASVSRDEAGSPGFAAPSAPESAPSPLPPTDSAGETAADVEQRIIKTASLSVVVDDVEESVSRIAAAATGKGGFVHQSSVSARDDGTHFGSMTVRVPSAQFEVTVEELKSFANFVESENLAGQDVTEQYTDLEARLRNARAQEETYLRILDQAEDIEDILAIQRELGNVRAQIESLEGRIQYLENRTALSTITVSLSEEPSFAVPTKEFRPGTAVAEAGRALVQIGQQLVIALIWLAVVGGGIILPVALVIWLGSKLIRMRKRRSTKKR